MNRKMLTIAAAAILLSGTTVWTSCSSPAEKEEKANEKVADAKDNLADAQQDASQASVKAANAEEWQAFKKETQAQIDANDAMISDLRKAKRKTNNDMTADAYKAKIDEVQEKNKQLRDRMDEYERTQGDWATFKSQYQKDMDELAQSIRDMKNK